MRAEERDSRGGEPEGSPPRGVHPLDLRHRGQEGVITTWLLEGPEPALIDPGPSSTLETLAGALEARGLGVGDLRHVLLTHVHLDHGGVTGHLASANGSLSVHVHADGLPHMADPTRLVASTRRTFGEAHDSLWGEARPVPRDQLRSLEIGGAPFPGGPRVIATPGHIGHHLSFLLEEGGVFFAGDSLGIILAPGGPTHPATPPPGVDVPAWLDTLDRIGALGARWAALSHSGLHPDPAGRAQAMESRLRDLVTRIQGLGPGQTDPDRARFDAETRDAYSEHVSRDWVDTYFGTFQAASDWDGVAHFLTRNPGYKLPPPG